jgi:hypothetical protein
MQNFEKIHAVYKYLMAQLTLNNDHKENLLKRGFNANDIEVLGYKSLPIQRAHIAAACANQFNNDLSGVPGFWKNDHGVWQLSGQAGLCVPVRNIDGLFSAIKIRSDNSNSKQKYTHLSSNPKTDADGKTNYPHGTAATISVHYPIIESRGKLLRITEGEIKSDLISLLNATYTISIPGINAWEWALDSVKILKPERVLLAFDADKNKRTSTSTGADTEPFAVAKALSQLYLALKELKIDVVIEDWPEEHGKGLDDVLSAGFDQIRILTENEAKEFVEDALKNTMPTDWLYVISARKFINLTSMQKLDKEGFNDKFAPNFKKGSPSDAVLRNPAFPRVDDQLFEPRKPVIIEENHQRFLNLWRPSDVQPEAGTPEVFLRHCEYLIPNEEERNILYDFLAHNIQHEGDKIRWAIILQTIDGTGKSYFGKLMKKLLGKWNVSTPTNNEIHQDFNSWQKACSFVVVEEIMSKGKLDLMNSLKTVISEPDARIREMHRDFYSTENKFNMLMFTNHRDAIIVDENDRRYCAIYTDAIPKETSYFKTLWDDTEQNAGKILNFLQQRDLSKFEPKAHAPMTAGKKELIRNSRSALVSWMEECIETQTWPFHSDLVSTLHLLECLPHHLKLTSINALGNALTKLKFDKPRIVRLSNGSKARVWAIRKKEIYNCATEKFIADEYEKGLKEKIPGANPLLEAKPF